MKKGDRVYVVDIDTRYPSIYKATIIKPHKEWKNNWLVRYSDVIFDFLNMSNSTLEGKEGIYSEGSHIFKTLTEALNVLTLSKFGMSEINIIKRLFE